MKIRLNLFEILFFWWMELLLFALLIAILGVFYKTLLLAFFLLQLFIFGILLKRKFLIIEKIKRADKFVLGLICVTGIFLAVYSEPTVFGGRDEGSLAIAGILLSKDHGLVHEDELTRQFGAIYQQGKALNFPGFYYHDSASIRTQFLPGYPVWIGIIFSFLGLFGLKFVNLIPFIGFVFSFYLVIREISARLLPALIGVLALITAFPIFVFYKLTLTEIFFAAFVWFSVYLIFKYFKNRNFTNYALLIYSLVITPFVRIEAVLIIFSLFLIFLIFDASNFRKKKSGLMFAVLMLAGFISLSVNFNFYFDTFKGVIEVPNNTEQSDDAGLFEEGFSFIPDDWRDFYLPKVLLNYGILPLIIFAFLVLAGGFFALIRDYKNNQNKDNFLEYLRNLKTRKKLFWIPLVLFCLIFYYLIDPNISSDHPWMLRRFVFAIIPVCIFYGVLDCNLGFLRRVKSSVRDAVEGAYLRSGFLGILLIGFLIFYNLYLIIPFWNFTQNKDLLSQLEDLSKDGVVGKIGEDDLLLVSQKASGSGWSLVSEPLRVIYGKPAVYFFNPDDLNKLDKNKFDKLYLLALEEEKDLYKNIIKEKKGHYSLEYSIVKPSKKPFERPGIEKIKVDAKIWEVNYPLALLREESKN
ncbi:MAG: hypothetical protein GF347_04345 [Candidatus Moranbacteria bacterium]|nr:hypothetical protein [Candidatus Moranbacteria bacterium]